jgi:hypothetical protein
MDPDVAFFAGIIAAAVWQREQIAGIKVQQGTAEEVDGAMVMVYPTHSGKKMRVTIDLED